MAKVPLLTLFVLAVTTIGADRGGTAPPVTQMASTGPVAASTRGRRSTCHDS